MIQQTFESFRRKVNGLPAASGGRAELHAPPG